MKRVLAYVLAISATSLTFWHLCTTSSTPDVAVVIAMVVGLCVGSFLNVVAYRWPAAENVLYKENARQELGLEGTAEVSRFLPFKAVTMGRSHCPNCNHKLGALELVPVFSWLARGGKCSSCKQPISMRYGLVELLVGLGTAAVVAQLGLTAAAVATVFALWFGTAAALVDGDHLYLPPFFTEGMVLAVGAYVLTTFQGTKLAMACATALGCFFLVGRIFPFLFELLTGRQGLGQGDAILYGMLGAVYGASDKVAVALLGTCMCGIVSYAFAKAASAPAAANESEPLKFAFGPSIILVTLAGMIVPL